MEKSYYEEYYQMERSHWWFQARLSILREIIHSLDFSSTHPLRILNIGAATGATSIMLQEFGDVMSVEYDSDCFEFLRDHVNIEVIQASVTALPLATDSFDLVCCLDVIEHVEDDQAAALEIERMVKPRGYALLTVPAFMSLWSHHDEINHHFRRYTMQGFLQLFEPTNLILDFRSFFNFSLFFPIAAYRFFHRLWSRPSPHAASDMQVNKGIPFVNQFFFHLFRLERKWLKKRRTFPIGVSILTIFKKP